MSINNDLNISEFKSPYLKFILNVLFTGYWLNNGINKALKPLGLTEPQFNTLSLLFKSGVNPMNISEIQRGMIQKESNVSRIIDKLHKKGWVLRKTCDYNRRKADVKITKEGKKIFMEASHLVRDFHEPLNKKLNESEYNQLSEILDKLRS